MPMGVVSDKDFESELKNSGPTVKKVEPKVITPVAEVIDMPNRGRKPGDVNVPDSLRNVIGTTAIINGREEALEIGREFGISPSSVSAYSNGSHSTTTYDDKPNGNIINTARMKVANKARRRLNLALDNITNESLSNAKVRDVAAIAKDMAVIIKIMEPEVPVVEDKKEAVQFVIFAPQFRDERSFDTIYAKDTI